MTEAVCVSNRSGIHRWLVIYFRALFFSLSATHTHTYCFLLFDLLIMHIFKHSPSPRHHRHLAETDSLFCSSTSLSSHTSAEDDDDVGGGVATLDHDGRCPYYYHYYQDHWWREDAVSLADTVGERQWTDKQCSRQRQTDRQID